MSEGRNNWINDAQNIAGSIAISRIHNERAKGTSLLGRGGGRRIRGDRGGIEGGTRIGLEGTNGGDLAPLNKERKLSNIKSKIGRQGDAKDGEARRRRAPWQRSAVAIRSGART